jgi:HEAT repeat protein
MIRCWKTKVVLVVSLLVVAGVVQAAEDSSAKISAAIRTAQNWKDGDPAGDLSYLSAAVVTAAQNAEKNKAMEQLMIQGLAGAKTRAGRDFFCRQLVVVGSEAAVAELAKLLTDAESSHMARYALARIPGPAANAALLETLDKVDEKLKVGMVHSLGVRRCRQSVDKIAAFLDGSHEPDLVVASLVALSRIDSEAAVAAVAKARESVPAKLKMAATDAYLNCVARMVQQGKAAEAVAIYRKLFAAEESTMCRIAALTGLVAAQKEQSVPTVISALADRDAGVRRAAASALRYVPGAEAGQAIIGSLFAQGEDVQVMLLAVLADRRDAAALPAILKAAESANPAVRLAALAALATLGDASVVPMLAGRAATAKDPAEQQAARNSLNNLRGNAVNAAIARQLGDGQPGVRIEAARSLAARGAVDQSAALFRAAEDKQAALAIEALKALRALTKAEQIPALVKLLAAVKNAAVRGEAENTVVTVAATTPAGKNPAEPVLAALPGAAEPEARASLIRVLGRTAHASALPILEASVKDSRAEVKDAAIRALADWPTGEPAKVVWAIATDPSSSRVHRIVALRGYVNMIAKQAQATDDQILDDYARSLELASRVEDKQLILSKLALVRHRRALEMTQRLSSDPALKQSAEAAIASIQRLLAAPARVTASKNPEAAFKAIDKDPNTRWDTGAAMSGGEWFRIELDEERLIAGLVLDTRGSGGDYPRGYEVYVSSSSLGEGQLVVKGEGKGPVTEIKFDKPVRGRAVKIVQTGEALGAFWSIHELTIQSQPVEKK